MPQNPMAAKKMEQDKTTVQPWQDILKRVQHSTPSEQIKSDIELVVIQLVATCLEHDRFQTSANAFVTELATRLSCSRVSLGLIKGKHIQIRAISHSSRFEQKSNLVRAMGATMDEAMDQETTIIYPPIGNKNITITHAHAKLAQLQHNSTICTIPLTQGNQVVGGLILERASGKRFEPTTVRLCEHVAALVGPVLELKYNEERWLLVKIWESLLAQVATLTHPGQYTKKTIAITLVLLVLFFSFATGTYRISADAILEGSTQRVVTAPIEGFIASANVRAGDIVKAGQIMGQLDDKDLKLERKKWASEHLQLLQEYREALAKHDRAQVSILSAKVKQAEARLELVTEQLARMQIIAPYSGIVIEGDLNQSLGAPVERGQVLFKVAPLDSYRTILKIDEREIASIAVGQQGMIALSSMPSESIPIIIERITPVSVAEGGRNYFKVEAKLDYKSEKLRPGMQGIGKIEAGQRKLIWIWTHKLTDWLRLWFWSI